MYIFIANKFIEIYAGFMRLCGICEICGKSHNRIKPASLVEAADIPVATISLTTQVAPLEYKHYMLTYVGATDLCHQSSHQSKERK